MKPYYQDNSVCIFLGDCREILPQLEPVDLVLTDPPWNLGFFEDDQKTWVEYRLWLAEMKSLLEGIATTVWIFQSTKSIPHVADLFVGWDFFADSKNFCRMVNSRISNAWDIAYFNNSISFDRAGSGWRNWHLANNANNNNLDKSHPTARPYDTMIYIIGMYMHQVILDPFMGSGTTLRAAKDLGRKAIGIEIEEKYCEIAAKRMSQEVLSF